MSVPRWRERLIYAVLLIGYVTALWGQAGRLLPAPFDGWHGLPWRIAGGWWQFHAPEQLDPGEQAVLFQLLAAWLLAFVVPVLVAGRLAVPLQDLGLAWSGRAAWRAALIGSLLSTPVGFWLALDVTSPWGSLSTELMGYLFMLPEHLLLFGVFGALLLPEGWAAQGADRDSGWIFAILAAGLAFGLLHVGTPHVLELWLSFPLGVLFAVLTFASGSIWPAVFAHGIMNIVPMLLMPAG